MIASDRYDHVEVCSQSELREWLTEYHGQQESVWLVTYKKATPDKYVSTSEILDELLSFGWIDGVRRKLDDRRTMQLISPRKAQHWTKSYKDRAARLEKKGMMTDAGRAAIEQSKANGMWSFMDEVDALVIPVDLQEALELRPSAQAFFESINPSSKRFVLRWLKLSKTDKTRQRRIVRLVDLAAQGKKLPGS